MLPGLLIAEWRRRKYGHRVLYACPTQQLARQAAVQKHSPRCGPMHGLKRRHRPVRLPAAGHALVQNIRSRCELAT